MYIIDVPIEPLPERYSIEWSQWFVREFHERGHRAVQVLGVPLTEEIENGSFLDCYGTHYYKFQQLQTIVHKLYCGERPDVIFFHDLWFPGIEALEYIRKMMNLRFKIAGYLHAGTYDPNDRLAQEGMGTWGKYIEMGWFQFFDAIFVGSEYHKFMIVRERNVDEKKVYSIGYPCDYDTYDPTGMRKKEHRENIVVFPHRLNKEKQPEMFDQLPGIISEILKRNITEDFTFVKTKDVCQTKAEYYELLGKAKIAVSFAKQETFGIAMAEAALMGCIPITPNAVSYTDTMEWMWRFENLADAAHLVIRAMQLPSLPYEWSKEGAYKPKKIMEQILHVLDT